VELVEIPELGAEGWAQLADGEDSPFGAVGESLSWGLKERRVALRDDDGRIVASAAWVLVPVAVEGHGEFQVVGVGGVMVTHTRRGEGLFWRVVEPALERAAALGPERAMLFCRPELQVLYTRLGFQAIEAPVWADQPDGRIEMPMAAMWRPLREGVTWPPGRVDVRGLPF
jgi:predicted N-acetyltransferase YhbS